MLEEWGSDTAEELLEKDLAAPSLWLLEAGNALWRRAVRGELTQAEAVERLTALTKAPVASVPLEQDLPEAMRLALQLNHPVYDCLYLALAKRLGTYVVTANTRFGRAVADHGTHMGQHSDLVADNSWLRPTNVEVRVQAGASINPLDTSGTVKMPRRKEIPASSFKPLEG